MNFDYFYGNEVEQHVFFRIPKALIIDDYFENLSPNARILYSLMLDRLGLSIKNRWLDKQNRAYIIYTIKGIQENLRCAKATAVKLVKELAGIGLVEKKRQGLNKPNLIYVKNFSTPLKYRKFNDQTSESSTYDLQEVQELNQNNNNNSEIDFNETHINNNPIESPEKANSVVVFLQKIKDLIFSQLHKNLTDMQATMIFKSKGFDFERLKKIIQVAKGQNIKNLVGWLVAAVKNPDFDLKPESVDGSVNTPNSMEKPKNKICNYKGADWDFEELKRLENQLIDEKTKGATYDTQGKNVI